MSRHRLGGLLLLQEHRGAWQLRRPPPDLPHDLLRGVKAGGGLQAETSRRIKNTPARYSEQTRRHKNWMVPVSSSLFIFVFFVFLFFPSSSSTFDTFCSFLERLGGFWEFCQISITSLPAIQRILPYVVHNSSFSAFYTFKLCVYQYLKWQNWFSGGNEINKPIVRTHEETFTHSQV